MEWSDAEKAKLVSYRERGLSWAKIGTLLNRSARSCQVMFSRSVHIISYIPATYSDRLYNFRIKNLYTKNVETPENRPEVDERSGEYNPAPVRQSEDREAIAQLDRMLFH